MTWLRRHFSCGTTGCFQGLRAEPGTIAPPPRVAPGRTGPQLVRVRSEGEGVQPAAGGGPVVERSSYDDDMRAMRAGARWYEGGG